MSFSPEQALDGSNREHYARLCNLRQVGVSTSTKIGGLVVPTTISCTFVAITAGEGNFCIQALQEDGNKLASPSLLGFELKPGTSYDTAWQLAQHMQNHNRGITVEEAKQGGMNG
jgi:hypothetical protein